MSMTVSKGIVYPPKKQVKPKKSRNRTSRVQLKRFTRSKISTFFYLFFIIALGLFSVLPLIYCICTAFKPLDELLIFPPRFFVHRPTLENFAVLPDLLSSLKVPITRYIFNSLFVSVITTFLHVVCAAMAAFVLSKANLKYSKQIFYMVQFSLLFSAYTLATPRYLIYSGMNIIDTYWIYILPNIPSATGVFLMKQYIDNYVPNELLEAAKIDGASFTKTFYRVVVPIISPVTLTLILFFFTGVWSQVPGGTIFSENLKTLPTVMSQITAGGIARSGSSMAVSVIMMLPPILVYLISQSSITESMSSSGIKG